MIDVPLLTANGAAYSARELTPWELDEYTKGGGYDVRFLIRGIGYPASPKCVSHYPGSLDRHRAAGRVVLLRHRVGTDDFAGGWDAGQAHARAALADARIEGYPENLPLIFTCDRRLDEVDRDEIPLSTALSYLDGVADVIGFDRTWCSGYADLVHVAQDIGAAAGFVLRGPETGVRDGIAFHRSDGERIFPGRIEADLLKAYVDLDAFEGDDFLMGLEPWQQERMYDRIMSMSAGVPGESFNGRQFEHHEQRLTTIDHKLDVIGGVLTRLAMRDGGLDLTDEETAMLASRLGSPTTSDLGDLADHLSAHLDLGRDTVYRVLEELYQPSTVRVVKHGRTPAHAADDLSGQAS
ncbi:hypothetical protein [Umezawaea sp.]|uniref:hypothetical protein n=1 Tax=Umezawaea sp. TaxID=1955258 RepID=UPI002ED69605